jgi:sulfide dehydrogenase [flavocytochrome c] flavoprotein subunit
LALSSAPALTVFPTTTLARTADHARTVIVGGGFGGAACAKYLRRYDRDMSITLIEPKEEYITCLFSNTVLAGMNSMKFITHGYNGLVSGHNIQLVRNLVSSVIPNQKQVALSSGEKVAYDYLVLSPGIDFIWDQIEGYDEETSNLVPHAWRAGKQTRILRNQLESMQDGGVVLIGTPSGQFRAPPAPYERASMIAYYLKNHKPRSKILLLDSSSDFASRLLFTQAWENLYPGMIEWVGNSTIAKLDVQSSAVMTTGGDRYSGDVINIIPPQRAGIIAQQLELTDNSGWCPVNQKTFESLKMGDVFIIGDSCIAGELSKAASAANTQAKACAAAIFARISGQEMPDPVFMDIFYGLIAKHYAISDVGFYQLVEDKIKRVSGGLSSKHASDVVRHREMVYAEAWYHSITTDTFSN